MADPAPDGTVAVTPPPAAAEMWRKLLDYTLANPLKVFGLAVVAFGGVLLLAFFTDIEHLPALDLQGIASMLYAVSLIGLALLVSVAAMLVAPGVLTRSFLDDLPPAVLPDESPAPGLPAEAVMAALTWVAVFLASASLLVWLLFRSFSPAWTAIGIGAAWLGYGGLTAWLARRPGRPQVHWHWMLRDIVIASACFTAALGVILQFVTVGDLGRSDLGVIAAQLLLLLAICAFIAWVISATRRPVSLGAVIVMALVLMTALILLTRSLTATPHLIVRKLRLGDIEFASVGVTAAGCQQVNAALGANVCEPPRDANGLATLCPVALRSRMGADRLLEFGVPQWQDRKTADGPRLVARWPVDGLHRVVLGADAMPSWRPLRPELDPQGLAVTAAPAGVDVQVWREAEAASPGADTPLRRLCAVRLVPPTAASAASR